MIEIIGILGGCIKILMRPLFSPAHNLLKNKKTKP